MESGLLAGIIKLQMIYIELSRFFQHAPIRLRSTAIVK
jgi:hypothetical protein